MKRFYLVLVFLTTYSLVFAQLNINKIWAQKEKINREAKQTEFTNHKFYKKNLNLGSSTKDYGNVPEFQWSKEIGGSGTDIITDVITDDDGNYYVTGSFSGDIGYDTNNYSSNGLRDGFIAKFDVDHNILWFKQISPNSYERVEFNDIHLDTTSGEVLVTGYFSGDIQIEGDILTANYVENLLYIKLNNSGNILYAGTHETSWSAESGKRISTDLNSNMYILLEHHILKYDQSGNLLAEMKEDEVFSDFIIQDNYIYIVGSKSTQSGTIGGIVYSSNLSGYSDMFLAKSDLDLNFSLVKVSEDYQNNSNSFAWNINADENKNLYITGSFKDSLKFGDVGIEENLGNYQGFLIKMDTAGVARWGSVLDFVSSSVFSATTSLDSISYITYDDNIDKYDHNGNILSSIVDSNYLSKAITINKYTSEIVKAGYSNGALYFSDLTTSLVKNKLTEFSCNSSSTYIAGMASDSTGNIYVYGQSTLETNYSGYVIPEGVFFAKHNQKGELIWLKTITNASVDYTIGDAITIDPVDENIYITGEFFQDITIPGGENLSPDSDGSVFILKYDVNGNHIWSQKIDALLFNDLDITADYSGNIILSNLFKGSIDIGSDSYNSYGSFDIVTIKFDLNGNIVWSKQAGGESVEYIGITSVDEDDNVYFTGEFQSENVQLGDSSLTLNEGDGNILLAKISSEGEVQWITSHARSIATKMFGDYSCWPTDIKTLPNGYSYIKGWHGDSVAFSDTVLTEDSDENGYNYFIGKFNPQGEAVWVHSIDENDYNYGFDYNQMDVDKMGNVYFGAQIRDTVYFKHYQDEYEYIPVSNRDLFVAKYTSDGEIDWIKTMESRYGNNWISAVAVSDTNKVFVAGFYDDYISIGTDEFYSESRHGFITRIGKQYIFNAKFIVTDGANPISNAIITINGVTLTTDTNGEATINLVNGDYDYSVSKTGYAQYTSGITINNDDLTVNITLVNTYMVRLHINDGVNPVEGAEVSFADEETASTDAFGNVVFPNITDGKYNFLISKPDYNELSDSILVSGSDVSDTIKLSLITSVVTFNVSDGTDGIDGASIELNDTVLSTNQNGETNLSLPNGKYNYTVSKPDYYTVSDSIIVSGNDISEFIQLSLITSVITFNVTNDSEGIEGATITLNDTVLNTNAIGEADLILLNGEYNYTVEASGYNEYSDNITVSGEDLNENVILSIAFWQVTFNVTDGSEGLKGAVITIADSTISTNENGEATIMLSNGNYNYKVEANGYESEDGMIDVTDANVVVDVTIISTGIDPANKVSFSLYPNPTRNLLTVESDLIKMIEILNMQGQVLQLENVNKPKNILNVSHLKVGTYFIRITAKDGKVGVKKLIIR